MKTQRGTATVEFALIGLIFFVLLFGVIEGARALFVWNGLAEATRRGARVAAVCPMNHPGIARIALMGAPGGSGASPVLPGLTGANIGIDYLDENGGAAAGYTSARFVRVRITGYQFALLFPFGVTLDGPAAATTLPVESLGYIPDLAMRACYGV